MKKLASALLCIASLGCGVMVEDWNFMQTQLSSQINASNRALMNESSQQSGMFVIPTDRELFGWLRQSSNNPWALTFGDAEKLF